MREGLQQSIVEPLQQSYGDRLRAVVAFGSVAVGRDEPSSDLELLVGVAGLPAKRIQRASDKARLGLGLKFSRHVDMLLTLEECQANFQNHNPLFLDIAFDGLVLFDGNLITELIEETKSYVARRGIIRRKTGWTFPVAYRRATSLSNVTNADWASAWIEAGIRDLKAAHSPTAQELYETAVFTANKRWRSVAKLFLSVGERLRSPPTSLLR